MTAEASIWETLGIAPGAEQAAIRRAYAIRLRGIDVDRNPAAFIRLRTAYEQALAFQALPARQITPTESPRDLFETDDDEEYVAEAAARAPDEPIAAKDGIRDSEDTEQDPEPEEWLNATLAEHGIVAAWQGYNRFLAHGVIGLKQQRPLAAQLATAALEDPGLAVATLLAITAILGPENSARRDDETAALRRKIAARVAAQRWLDALQATTRKRAYFHLPYFFQLFFIFWSSPPESHGQKYVVRAARVFLHRRENFRRKRAQLEAIDRLFTEYRVHEVWLSGHLDTEWLVVLEARLRRAFVRRARREKIFLWTFGIFLMLSFILGFLLGH